MTNFDDDSFNVMPGPTPESFENTSHIIMKYPAIQIDLAQPNRVDDEVVEEQIGIEGAKLVAEITTPTREIGIFYGEVPGFEPIVMAVDGKDPSYRKTIGRGEDADLSDTDGEGKCIVTVDIHGRVFVNAEEVDTNYQISTRELTQFAYAPPQEEMPEQFPSDYPDDPES